MIARIWKGAVRTQDGDAYAEYMQNTGISGYANTPGNHSVRMLRRDLHEKTEFLMFTLWDSLDAVKAFAGANYESAVFYPEDERFLVERDPSTTHYLVDTQILLSADESRATRGGAATIRTGLQGEGVGLRRPEAADSEQLLDLYLRNRSFLEPWTPHRPESFYTRAAQERAIADACAAWDAGSADEFLIESDEGELVGRVALSSVARGPFQNAYLGYFIDKASAGRGYATEAVRLALEFAFVDAQLHRVQAAVIPHQHRLDTGARKARVPRGRTRRPLPSDRRRLGRPPHLRPHPRRPDYTRSGLLVLTETDVRRLRAETPGCNERIHFNNAGAGLLPLPKLATMTSYLELEAAAGGYEAAAARHEQIDDFYRAAAQLLGCRPENVAFSSSANGRRRSGDSRRSSAVLGLTIASLAGSPPSAGTGAMSQSTRTPSRVPRMKAAKPPSPAGMVSLRAGWSLSLRKAWATSGGTATNPPAET